MEGAGHRKAVQVQVALWCLQMGKSWMRWLADGGGADEVAS